MKVLNETPAIFDLSVRWKPPENAPLQEPGKDSRSAFDFPAFDLPTESSGSLTGYHEETLTFYDEECNPVEKTVLVKDA